MPRVPPAARVLTAAALAAALALPACARREPARRFTLEGQVLAVDADRGLVTVRHEDIPGYMPGMTMSFPVGTPDLLEGRRPGERIRATLEVQDLLGRLVAIEHLGDAPLPDGAADALAAGLLAPGDEVPDAALIDQTDRRRTLAEWRGALTLVTFTYTRCPLPTYCPLMDQNFATLQRLIAEDARLRGRVRLVSVTVDPAFDTPDVLARHAGRLRADPAVWTFLTGDRITIDRLAARFGVAVLRDGDEAADITHNLRTSLIGADGRVIRVYGGNEWTPGQVAADLRAALAGS